MAADTYSKRLSAINIGSPWRGILPVPSGTIDQAGRQAAAFLYSGLLLDPPPIINFFIDPYNLFKVAAEVTLFKIS